MTTNTATAIKAIPTLYGEEARRFRDMADEAELLALIHLLIYAHTRII